MTEPRVIAVTATYRRPAGLSDLLRSLESERGALAGLVVIDNAAMPQTAEIARQASLQVQVVTPPRNLGCGGGVAAGLQTAFGDPRTTHAWILDDDAVSKPGALSAMLSAMERAGADAAVPLITDARGCIGWFPGPLTEPAWGAIRAPNATPASFRATCGTEPRSWTWAPWTSLVVTRCAVENVGLPRDDFWFQGEDLEWTLRITARGAGVLAPAGECQHLPPAADAARARLKRAAMLQNTLFTATRLPHGRGMIRHLPGNAWRFLREGRFTAQTIGLALRAYWLGGVLGRPAGVAGGDAFRRRWERVG
jgi:GT2 family glycosyltransferase